MWKGSCQEINLICAHEKSVRVFLQPKTEEELGSWGNQKKRYKQHANKKTQSQTAIGEWRKRLDDDQHSSNLGSDNTNPEYNPVTKFW